MTSKWIRTCQECGHIQKDIRPKKNTELSKSYECRKCKDCGSEALDYGKMEYKND